MKPNILIMVFALSCVRFAVIGRYGKDILSIFKSRPTVFNDRLTFSQVLTDGES